jgi:myo-inositol-1(or 4)-monophosphatase
VTDADLRHLEELAARIVEQAGDELMRRFAGLVTVDYKDKQESNPVTEADRAVEHMIGEFLARELPHHGLLGEEGADQALDHEFVWVLDPLDGTANFAGRLPFFGVSLSLLHSGVPVVGAMFMPFAPTLQRGVIRASTGNGAWVGDTPLRVESAEFRAIDSAALPLGGPFGMTGELAKKPGNIRNVGSIVYEIGLVAGGGLKYAAFGGPRAWDVAAGVVAVREAGGDVYRWRSGAWHRFERFEVPPPRRDAKKPPTMRDWAMPMLFVGRGAERHVVPNLIIRRPSLWRVVRGWTRRRIRQVRGLIRLPRETA